MIIDELVGLVAVVVIVVLVTEIVVIVIAVAVQSCASSVPSAWINYMDEASDKRKIYQLTHKVNNGFINRFPF